MNPDLKGGGFMAFRILSDPDLTIPDDFEEQDNEPGRDAFWQRVDLALDELRDGVWEEHHA
jgi:hypothetical protein